MTAESIARALGGRSAGLSWIARCPAHDDREPSLSIREADGMGIEKPTDFPNDFGKNRSS